MINRSMASVQTYLLNLELRTPSPSPSTSTSNGDEIRDAYNMISTNQNPKLEYQKDEIVVDDTYINYLKATIEKSDQKINDVFNKSDDVFK